MRRVVVRPLAMADLEEAANWYEGQRSGLGEELADEVIKAINRANEAPEAFQIVRIQDGIRRVSTKRFPYRIFFSVADETLYVHAILHAARHDRHWRNRG